MTLVAAGILQSGKTTELALSAVHDVLRAENAHKGVAVPAAFDFKHCHWLFSPVQSDEVEADVLRWVDGSAANGTGVFAVWAPRFPYPLPGRVDCGILQVGETRHNKTCLLLVVCF